MAQEQSRWERFRNSIKKAFEPPPLPPMEERTHKYLPAMQSALTAYFNVHALDKEMDLPEGLCIPFCPVENLSEKAEAEYNSYYKASMRSGFLIATGEKTEAGDHMFRARFIRAGNYGSYELVTLPVPFLPNEPS